MKLIPGFVAISLISLGVVACSDSKAYSPPTLKPEAGSGETAGTGGPSFPITGINSAKLTVTAVEPASGPFSGGTTAVVRGSGFDDGAVVRVGGIAVQPDDITRDGKNRINIVVPAGKVGAADVSVTQGDTTVTLSGGFLYSAMSVSPNTGSIAGGSLVELEVTGAPLTEDLVIEFDGVACTELKLTASQRATCKTPPHAAGQVDVVARQSSASPDAPPTFVATKAFEYIETLDAASGGLSGGPVSGTLNVTVLDYNAGNVIPKALVLVGNDPMTKMQGFTDARGAITFSDVDLHGPVTIHASAKCFERMSIVSFDAQNVTLFLTPILDLTCAAEGDPGPTRKQLASTVSGELIFPGAKEFEVNSWDIVPQPKAKEIRVAYVFTTQASLDSRNPDPASSGDQLAKLVETTAVAGERGFQYRIVARPGGLAVYALAGLERLDTREFTPYVMGVAHNVVTSPGEETKHVDMTMTITLDRELDVQLSGVPAPLAEGPDHFEVRAFADLGGEGVVVRNVNDTQLDLLTRRTSTEPFRFLGQPAFVGQMKDANYYVLAGYYTTGAEVPYTNQKRTGVRQTTDAVQFGPFLSIPKSQEGAAKAAPIPVDRKLRFDLDGPTPDLLVVDILGGDGLPAWRQILPGDAREIPIPDLSQIKGQSDIAGGLIQWQVTAIKLDAFQYNQFQYTYLQPRYWTHSSSNLFYARR